MPIPRFQPETIGYFAGLFDGEGTVTVNVKVGPKGGTGVLYIAVGSTDMGVTAEMKKLFGGYLTTPRISSKRSTRLSRDWKATNGTALEFLKLIYPFLRIKKRQAALAFKFRKIMDQTLHGHDVHRIKLFQKIAGEISSLNHGRDGVVETVKQTPQGEEPVHCPGATRSAVGDDSNNQPANTPPTPATRQLPM